MRTSFAEMHPELVSEWSGKNAPIKVTDVTYGSNKQYWWIGKCGHEWLASPKDRHNGEKCPYCAGMRVLEGFNDLASVKPDLALEWSDKNLPLLPTQVNAQTHRKVKWKGVCGHEWEAEIKARVRGNGCPYCSNNKVLPGFNDLATVHPEIAKEWSERNLPWTAEMAPSNANRLAWWKCEKGHEWQTLISTRVKGSSCPYCSGERLLEGFNDLGTLFPGLAKEWSDRNYPLMPTCINEKSRKNVWWKCRVCGYEWKSVVYARVHGGKCPACDGRAVMKGFNDLSTTDPEVAKEWNYDRNDKGPEEYLRTSSDRVWWKGECGHEWSASIYDRSIRKMGCKVCEREFKEALPQLAILYYAGSYGLDVTLNDTNLTGMHIDAIVPKAGLAIDVRRRKSSKEGLKEYNAKRSICRKRGIDLYTITDEDIKGDGFIVSKGSSKEDILKAVLKVFNLANVHIETDKKEDLERIKRAFFRMKKAAI